MMVKKHFKQNVLKTAVITLLLSAPTVLAEISYSVDDSDFPPRNEAKEALGKVLFFDKILSGNKNISCATCHHPLTGIGDGLSLPVGEGGQGLGVTRNTGIEENAIVERVPRNAPPLFNAGALEFVRMFHDGRVAINNEHASGFDSPAGDNLPKGLDNVLAAQAMFPVTSATEMAGQAGENTIADATAVSNLAGEGGVWQIIAQRLQEIPEYVQHFKDIFPDVNSKEDITYVHAANAISAFEAAAWRCTNSVFDQVVKTGDLSIASAQQLRGAEIFYGKATCARCHSGAFQTDHEFYAIGIPQIGAGRGDGVDEHDDFGREQVTGDAKDRYKFRTPSLRQLIMTGPWGHDGAYDDLETVVRHHLNPQNALANYDTKQAVLPSRNDLNALDFIAHNDVERRQEIADASELAEIVLSDDEVADLMSFLHALTDFSCVDLRRDMPTSVPSGLSLVE